MKTTPTQDNIRKALTGVSDALDAVQIRAITGERPGTALAAMVKRDEVIMEGEGRKHTYRLNPDYTPDTAPPVTRRKRKKQRLKGFKDMKRARKKTAGKKNGLTYKELAQRARDRKKSNGHGLEALAVENHLAAGVTLRDYLRGNIDGFEDDKVLVNLVDNHERAESLVKAARTS
jgi:hypothetical protein